jgi:putative phosphoesterase
LIVGVISDTHGLLRREVVAKLRGCDHIIHAGDVGDPKILDQLRSMAAVTAVRGNIDRETWAESLAETELVMLDEHAIFVLHDLKKLDLNPKAAGISAVISGHTHKALKQEEDGVLYLNPGSVGPRRFSLPISMAKLVLEGPSVNVELRTFDL